jgi:hypothetical protein
MSRCKCNLNKGPVGVSGTIDGYWVPSDQALESIKKIDKRNKKIKTKSAYKNYKGLK